jgi:hypothetical protein
MRIMGLLATCAMALASSLGLPWLPTMPEPIPSAPEVSLCLVPMESRADSFGSCSDHTPSWSGGENQLDPG